jgi:hypothetical protein
MNWVVSTALGASRSLVFNISKSDYEIIPPEILGHADEAL